MVKLNDLQTAELLDEVASAMELKSPVIDSLRRLSDRRFGCVARTSKFLTELLERGESLDASFAQLKTPDRSQVVAAIRASERTGHANLLNVLSGKLRERHDRRGETQLIWFYPCILAFVAYVAFVTAMAPLIRDNDGLVINWPPFIAQLAHWVQTNFWVPLLTVVIIGVLAKLFLIKPQKLPRLNLQSLFYSTLASQLEQGVPDHEAIQTAAMMASETELVAGENLSFSTPRVKELINPEGNSDNTTSTDSVNKPFLIANLNHLAFVFDQKARERQYLWRQFIPQVVTLSLGSVMMLSIAWFVLAPVYREFAQW
ncbi:MAG: type II secretion system F family protein [Rubripirellula sp.]|nr:type II secretion system F family protein [Rubripirellula sp.]